MATKPSLVSWALLSVLGLIWGGSFLGVSVALTGFSPLWVAALRISLAAVLLLALAQMGPGLPTRRTPTGRRIWLHAFGFAIFTNALPFALLSWAQLRVTSGFAGITMAVVPLFVLPLAHVILPSEKMTPRKVAGFLMGFAGVVILIGPAALGGLGDVAENTARVACVCASACYAIGTMITRTAPQGPLVSYSAAGLLIASVIIIAAALFVDGPPDIPDVPALVAVLYLGLFPTALATVLLVRIINAAGPTFLSLVNYQVPVWAVFFGLLFLGEALPGSFVGALALILVGLAVSQARGWRFRP